MLTVGLPGLIKDAVVAALAETKKKNSDVRLSVGTPKTPRTQPPSRSASPSLQSTPSHCSSEEQILEEPEKSVSPKLTVCLNLYHV